MERVTVTLPEGLVAEIDRRESNRSRFVKIAVTREIERLRQEELQRSLANPYTESSEVAEAGLSQWLARSSQEDLDLVDADSGTPVEWSEGQGWVALEGDIEGDER